MVAKLLSVLALATVSFAHPNFKRHAHLHHGTGTGGGFAMPTGGTFPISNSTANTNGTDFGGSPVESSPVLPTATAVKTITVSPVPVESGSGADVSSASVAAAVASTTEMASAPSSSGSWPEGSGSGSGEGACSVMTSTVTSTSVQYVTVTATSADSGSEVAATSASSSSSAAFMPSGAAGGFYGAGSNSSSSAAFMPSGAAGGFYGAGSSSSSVAAVSTGGFGEFNGASTTSSTMSATSSISIAATASAGEFFGNPGKGSSSAWGGSSSAAVNPTTFATFTSSSPSSSAAGASSASSPTSSSAPSSGGSSSGKKGLSYNTASLTDAFAGKGISWAYNWGASPDGSIVSGAEFVPMFWGPSSVSGWASAAAAAIAGGAQHALSLNEPDLSSQSNVDPVTAAQLHIANMNPLAGQVQIGSPAVTNGAGTNPLMGIDWLNAFFKACAGQCKVDFVAFHWYDSASNFGYLQSHVQDVINAAAANGVGKVWLTEFGASGSDSDVSSFLDQAIPWLDSQSAVERYAYFMCSDGILVDGTSISSPVGNAYVSA